jgi:hypothetical protein
MRKRAECGRCRRPIPTWEVCSFVVTMQSTYKPDCKHRVRGITCVNSNTRKVLLLLAGLQAQGEDNRISITN